MNIEELLQQLLCQTSNATSSFNLGEDAIMITDGKLRFR